MSSEWKEFYLGELYDSSSGLSKGRKDFGYGYPFLAFKDVFNNYFIPEKLTSLANTTEKERNNCSVKEGDIFITRTSETQHELGMSSVALKDYPETTFNGFTKRLRKKSNTDIKVYPKYMGYYLRSPEVRNQIYGFSTMTTRSSLNNSMLEKIKIRIPHYEEQQVIADSLFCIDQKFELNKAINKNLEEMAQALFKRWFVDFEFPNENGEPYKSSGGEFEESELGLIPKGWSVGVATEIFNVQSGGTPKTGNAEYWDGEIPFFTPKDSGNSFYVINTEKKLTENGLSNCNSKLYKTGTVFITARGTVGKLSIAGRDMAMNQSCYALVATNGYTQKYIFLQTQLLINAIKKNASGAVFDAITVSTFQSLKVALPNIELVLEFDKVVESIFNTILKNIIENQILLESRDTLLPKLMSGELRVPMDCMYSQVQMFDLPLAAENKAQYTTT